MGGQAREIISDLLRTPLPHPYSNFLFSFVFLSRVDPFLDHPCVGPVNVAPEGRRESVRVLLDVGIWSSCRRLGTGSRVPTSVKTK